ncbi:fibronectin type III domain-containing protein [Listeria innocua]|nr:fibronectin type III domain-containing protein [Listeria innocua]MBC2140144.1 fibronectin type III domain-containing protein [Listeria innocua]
MNNAESYLVYVNENEAIQTVDNTIVINGLEPFSIYSISISAENVNGEGAKSTPIIVRTLIPAPVVDMYLYGTLYLTGITVNDENVTNFRVYAANTDDLIAVGTVENGVMKAYLWGNSQVVVGARLDVCALDGLHTDENALEGVRTTFEVTIPLVALNALTLENKTISGETSPGNVNVRLFRKGVQQTIVTSANDGTFSYELDSVEISDGYTATTQVGTAHSSTISYYVSTTIGELTSENYDLGTDYVTGTYTGNVVRVALEVNLVVGAKVPVLNSTDFSCAATDIITSVDDKVRVLGFDSSNRLLSRIPVTIGG